MENVVMRSGQVKEFRRAVWSPVLHFDEEAQELWLFYSQSTRCLQYTKQYGKRIRLARWGPGASHNLPEDAHRRRNLGFRV